MDVVLDGELVVTDERGHPDFWRDRRNECAHFKNNPINSSHADAYWLFLRSQLDNYYYWVIQFLKKLMSILTPVFMQEGNHLTI
jgi:hypothetical protein